MKRLIAAFAIVSLSVSALHAEEKLSAGNLNFTLPAGGWKSVPSSSPMRAAVLEITVEGAEKPLEAVFYYFGAGQGGDVKANVDRWLGQFESPPVSKTEELDANGTKVTLVTATGTYMDGAMFGPKTPKADYTLLASIIPGPDAPVFIKLAGPKDVVTKISEDFKKLSTSPFAK